MEKLVLLIQEINTGSFSDYKYIKNFRAKSLAVD